MHKRQRLGATFAGLAGLAAAAAAGLAGCDTGSKLHNARNVATPLTELNALEVEQVIVEAVTQAQALGLNVAVAVTDREGEVLGAFRMTAVNNQPGPASAGNVGVAISKAATAGAFQSEQNAFTTRTALFIVQGNYPPGVRNIPAGPLFGVQDSSLQSADVHPLAYDAAGNATGAGIQGEFGGLPLFKNGAPVGGVGVDSADRFELLGGAQTLVTPVLNDLDEAIALVAANATFPTPSIIDATNVFVDGISFPFADSAPLRRVAPAPGTTLLALAGAGLGVIEVTPTDSGLTEEDRVGGQYGVRADRRFIPRVVAALGDAAHAIPTEDVDELDGATAPTLVADPATATFGFQSIPIVASAPGANLGGIPGEIKFPFIDSIDPPPADDGLTAAEVEAIIARGSARAESAAAGIRLPRGEGVRVHLAVVDTRGNLLGLFRMGDGTIFSFDVAVQKARTCAFFSTDGQTDRDFDGTPITPPLPAVAFGVRSIGFLAQPFFPPGIDGTIPGPLVHLRDLVNRGKLIREAVPSLTLLNPPPSAPSDGTTDEDPLTPGVQLFDDFAGLTAPGAAELAAIRATIGATGGFHLFADLAPTARGDTAAGDFVSPGIQNGIQTFPGAVPLYRNGRLIGAVGVSGDGVDEDDQTAFGAATGFEPPRGVRVDEAEEGDIIAVLNAKMQVLANAMAAHPDPAIAAVYGPLLERERQRVADRLALGLEDVRIPFVKLPRKPDDR